MASEPHLRVTKLFEETDLKDRKTAAKRFELTDARKSPTIYLAVT